MKLRWKRTHSDLYFGFSGANQVAQVAHVFGVDGADHGWMVLLPPDRELFDRYGTSGEAMAAAEAALLSDHGQ